MVIFPEREKLRMIRRSRGGIISINEAGNLGQEMMVSLMLIKNFF